jgi:anti-sigma factor (TIGR02949 family)
MTLINFDNHRCKKIISRLDSYMSDELPVGVKHEVLTHVESCAECAADLSEREQVKRLLRSAARKIDAPGELRERIQKSIRGDRRASFPRWTLAAAAAFVLLVGAWGAIRYMSGNAASERAMDVLRIGLRDHVECAIKHNFASRRLSIEEMGSRLGAGYAGLVPVIRERLPEGYELAAAHACQVGGRDYAHLLLERGRAAVSLVITRKGAEGFPEADLAATLRATGVPVHAAGIDGYQVAGFETRDFLGFVVSGLSREENLRVASIITPGMRDFLVGLEA